MPEPTHRPVVPLKPLTDVELKRIGAPPAKKLKTEFPKRGTRIPVTSALRNWQNKVAAPPAVRNPVVRIKAVPLTRGALTKFRNVVDAGLAPDVMAKQKMGTEELFGTLFSALTTHAFVQMEAEYRRRKAGARPPASKVDQQWQKHVRNFSQGFASAGLRNVGEAQLRQFAKELNASKANRDAVIAIFNSGTDSAPTLASTTAVAQFVPLQGVFIDPKSIITPIGDLCDKPISEGTFTKHFSKSISLWVKIKYPCGLSWSGIEWCTKKVTLAGVSFGIAVNVGYRVTCCGAAVWGQAGAQVCATIVGIKVCAQCTATIVGVAGVAKTPVGSGCQYGLGINATLKCTLAGATILNISYPFGWTITGPCPPPNFPC